MVVAVAVMALHVVALTGGGGAAPQVKVKLLAVPLVVNDAQLASFIVMVAVNAGSAMASPIKLTTEPTNNFIFTLRYSSI